MEYNKELVREIINEDNPIRKMDLFEELQKQIMQENKMSDIVNFATECLVYQLAVPQIPVTQTQFDAIARMYKVKGKDGRGGDRRSKKYLTEKEKL